METLVRTYGYLAVALGTFVEGETVLVLGGVAAHRGYLNLVGVIAAAFAGSFAGDQLYFFIGRRYGPRFFARRPGWAEKLDRVRSRFDRHRILYCLVFRFLYGLRTVSPFVIGASGMKPSLFVPLNALGALLWAGVIGGAGFVFGTGLEALFGRARRYELLLFGGLVAVAVGVALWRRFVRRGDSPLRGFWARSSAWALRRSREQWLVLFWLLVAGGLGAAFFATAAEMQEGEHLGADERGLLLFRVPGQPELNVGPSYLREVARDLTALGSVAVLGLVAVSAAIALLLAGRFRRALLLLGWCAGGAGLSVALKLLFHRPRPLVVPRLTDVASTSFPSGHAMMASVVYLTVGVMVANVLPRRLRLFVMVLAAGLVLVIGVTRVFLGVHYPSDVLGGWMAGVAWAALGILADRWLLPPRAGDGAGAPDRRTKPREV